jgi:hypothetical protein
VVEPSAKDQGNNTSLEDKSCVGSNERWLEEAGGGVIAAGQGRDDGNVQCLRLVQCCRGAEAEMRLDGKWVLRGMVIGWGSAWV